MDALNRQLKKGVLDVVILMLLTRGDMYGYELMLKLESEGEGFFTMKEGTLYPILYRLEDAGYIQSEWEESKQKRGVPRKYYALSQSGRVYLESARKELDKFIHAMKIMMEAN